MNGIGSKTSGHARVENVCHRDEAWIVHPDRQWPSYRSVHPKSEEIEITDIARALSNQCRFGGHCRVFYSVAQHASLVSDLVVERTGSPGDGLCALLHDAAEAYLVDLPHPLKHRSELGRLYRRAEERLQRVILERFQLPATPPPLLKEIDRALLATERRSFSAVAWH